MNKKEEIVLERMTQRWNNLIANPNTDKMERDVLNREGIIAMSEEDWVDSMEGLYSTQFMQEE